MSIASEITSIGENLKKDYQAIANLGADLTNVDKNIENIAELLDGVYDNLPKTEYQEGTDITIENGLKGKLDFENGVVGIGQSSQDSTQGYNLLPLNPTTLRTHNTEGTWANDYTYTNKGITYTIDYNVGKIKVNGTASSNSDFKIPITLTQGNTYRLSGCPSGGGSSNYRSYLFDIQSFTQAVYDNGSGAVMQSASYTNYEYRIRIANGYTANNIIFEPMVVEGSTAKTFEKYTGGQASPNPSYPQTINSVTGNQDVVVSGKNLIVFQNETSTIDGGNTTFTNAPSVTFNSNFIYGGLQETNFFETKLKAGTYSFNGFRVNQTNISLRLYNLDTSSALWSSPLNSGTFTLSVDTNVGIRLFTYGGGEVVEGETIYPILCVGDEIPTYEPYITPTSYQLSLGDKKLYDECYIVGSPDNWKFVDNMYKTKLKDVQLYNDWSVTQSNNLYCFWFVYEAMYGIPKGKMLDSDGNLAPILSNYFGSRNVFYNVNTEKNVIVKNTQPTSPMFIVAVDGEIASSVAEWKNYIANHEDLYIVYSTKEPLETPITDATLINQLNAWYNAHSLNGTTIITSNGELPMIIKVRGLKGE